MKKMQKFTSEVKSYKMNKLDKIILKIRFYIWARLKTNIYPSFNLSHSQFGEDMVLRYLTNDSKNGFYVDIGAHHPVYYSNTYHFYCKGWRGINIDACPGSMELFNILRSRDINLEVCLSPVQNSEVEFFIFDCTALNTCDVETANQVLSSGTANLITKKNIRTMTLVECLDLYLPPRKQINFMSIDVEGMDEKILMSNDWERYKPEILVFEKHRKSIQELGELPIVKHLANFGYELMGKCGPSIILKNQDRQSQSQ